MNIYRRYLNGFNSFLKGQYKKCEEQLQWTRVHVVQRLQTSISIHYNQLMN